MPGFNISGTGGTVDAKKDVYRSYRWRIKNIISEIVKITEEDTQFVLDVSVPTMDFDVLKVQGMSLEYKIPQKPTFNNVDITFYDVYGLQTKFEKWMKKIWNPANGLFDGETPKDLKGVVVIELLDHEGSETRTYSLRGAWPKRISHSKLSMSDDTLKTIVVEFVYDFYELQTVGLL